MSGGLVVARDRIVTLCAINSSGDKPGLCCGHTACMLGNKMFLLGGTNDEIILSYAYFFDPVKSKWEAVQANGFAPAGRFGHSCTEINGIAYIFGGLTQALVENTQGIVGAGAAGRLSGRAPFVAKARSVPAPKADQSAYRRERIMVESTSSDFFTFDPATRVSTEIKGASTWTESPSVSASASAFGAASGSANGVCTGPSARYYHAACSIGGGRLLVFGGCTAPGYQGVVGDAFIFDTVAGSWSQPAMRGDLPSARYGHTMTSIPPLEGEDASVWRVVLFGGACPRDDEPAAAAAASGKQALQRFDTVHVLDCATMTWSRPVIHGTPPVPRCLHAAALLNEPSATDPTARRLYIFAGETPSSSSDLCVLSLDTWRWFRPLFDGSFEHSMHSAVPFNDKLLVFGGLSASLGILDDCFFVNTVTVIPGAANNDFTFKIVIVGDSEVGKSCLMTRFVEDRYSDIHVTTIGVDFKTVTTMVEGKLVKLHIWDTAGQERFAQISAHYYRNADGAVLVYDTTNAGSLESIDTWNEAINASNGAGDSHVLKVLVGNKIDVADNRQVSRATGLEMAQRLQAEFIETSAKDSDNVDTCFLNLAKALVARRKAKPSAAAQKKLKLGAISSAQANPGKNSCCKS